MLVNFFPTNKSPPEIGKNFGGFPFVGGGEKHSLTHKRIFFPLLLQKTSKRGTQRHPLFWFELLFLWFFLIRHPKSAKKSVLATLLFFLGCKKEKLIIYRGFVHMIFKKICRWRKREKILMDLKKIISPGSRNFFWRAYSTFIILVRPLALC